MRSTANCIKYPAHRTKRHMPDVSFLKEKQSADKTRVIRESGVTNCPDVLSNKRVFIAQSVSIIRDKSPGITPAIEQKAIWKPRQRCRRVMCEICLPRNVAATLASSRFLSPVSIGKRAVPPSLSCSPYAHRNRSRIIMCIIRPSSCCAARSRR